jgi:hypothetical protein
VKGLFIVGGKGSGKTVMAKFLLKLAKERWTDKVDIMVFDPSLAWWHSAPLRFRKRVDGKTVIGTLMESDTLYELGRLDEWQLKTVLGTVLGEEYKRRYNGYLEDSDFLNLQPLHLPVLEEAQTLMKKRDMHKAVYDWVCEGRNLKMGAILCTQRPAEVDTQIIERCNLLVGYIEGDNNKGKIKRATNKRFKALVENIENRSYEFCYYNGKTYEGIKTDDLYYPAPVDV